MNGLTTEKANEKLPRHVAIIMDGNGRWAQQRGLPRVEGHRRGVDTVRMVCETATELKLAAITLYCLSSENWKRPKAELDFLMALLEQYLIEERTLIMEQRLVLRVIGRRDRLPGSVLREMQTTIDLSAGNSGSKLVLAIDYGGRAEIVGATQAIASAVVSGSLSLDDITEQTITEHLYTHGMTDPDLMIRTGGEMRISNFLLWQVSYAELWVTQRAWPEFTRADFMSAMEDYAARDRRYGGIADSSGDELG